MEERPEPSHRKKGRWKEEDRRRPAAKLTAGNWRDAGKEFPSVGCTKNKNSAGGERKEIIDFGGGRKKRRGNPLRVCEETGGASLSEPARGAKIGKVRRHDLSPSLEEKKRRGRKY